MGDVTLTVGVLGEIEAIPPVSGLKEPRAANDEQRVFTCHIQRISHEICEQGAMIVLTAQRRSGATVCAIFLHTCNTAPCCPSIYVRVVGPLRGDLTGEPRGTILDIHRR